MKKVIVTTTINPVNEVICKYDAMPDWDLIVTGDRKSPSEYRLKRGRFLSWEYQQDIYPELCDLVGPDNTQRGRMIAFIEAHKAGADVVATIDDDCDPMRGWPGPIYVQREDCVFEQFKTEDLVFDPFFAAGYKHPPRGYPPQLTRTKMRRNYLPMVPLVQENFWHGQADYDAVWRVHGSERETCHCHRPFWSNALSPVNTQNLLIAGSALKDHCGEIPFVGHVGDVWAGYLFQSYHPDSTLYAPANVVHWQERSLTSVLEDLKDELYSYEHGMEFVRALVFEGPEPGMTVLPEKAVEAIKLYRSYFE